MNHVKFLQWLLFILTVIVCVMTVLYLHYLPLISSFYTGFLNTILATLYSLWTAIFIYWQQQKQKFISLKSSMLSYLDYLQDYFENRKLPSPHFDEIEKENLPVFNRSFVTNLINSGFFSKDTATLIELQNSLDFHYYIIEKYLERNDTEGLQKRFQTLNKDMLKLIRRLYTIINRYY